MDMAALLRKRIRLALAGGLVAAALGMPGGALWAEDAAPAAPPPAAPAAQGDNDKRVEALLEEEAKNQKALQEEVRSQVEAHIQAGKRLLESFEYEGAQAEFRRALGLERTNREAKEQLEKVESILGYRGDRIKQAVQQLYGEQKVAIQARLVELDNRIDWGNRFAQQAKEDPELALSDRILRNEQAIQHFERAREIVKWMPPSINVDEQQNLVVRRIRELRQAIKATQVQLEESDRDRAQQMAEARREAERVFVQKKLAVLIDQAKALFEIGQYERAGALASKILEEDPGNAEANAIEATARDRQHIRTKRWIAEEDQEQTIRNIEKADRIGIPSTEYLIYPSNWSEISRRTGETTRVATVEPWKQEILKQMARSVSFEFVDTPLEEALNFLNTLSKVNLILDPQVQAEGAGRVPINLKVADMDMRTALKWILQLAQLDYDLKNMAVFITKKANLTANVELEIYDVRDLTAAVTDFPGPRIELGVAAQGQQINPFANQPAAQGITPEDLATLIQERLLAADFADPACTIDQQAGKLVVMQRPEVHEKIRRILQSFRETQTVQVLTQVRFVDVQDGFLEQIGVHFQGLDAAPGDPGLPFARVDPLRQPSKYGLFPIGGGPGLTSSAGSDVLPSPAFQFQDSVDPNTGTFRPPFHFDFGPPSSNPEPRTILLLRPRLDGSFPNRGAPASIGPAGAPAGFRRQWYEKWFGSPTLVQGLTQNLVNTLNGRGPLNNLLTAPNIGPQGAVWQFRFFHSIQASAVLQALRKDQTSNTLLAPRLMQFNNQRSHVMVAEQRSYIADYDVSGAVFDPVIRSFLTGVVLESKPTVSHDRKYITIEIRAGVAEELSPPQIIFITSGGNINAPNGIINLPIELPNIELRAINSIVTVPDNGTLLFSGLIRDMKIESTSGIPLLSDLPIIGRLFKTNLKQRERRNLLILVNCRVILFDEEEAKL